MTVNEIFANEKIEYVAALDLSASDVRRPDIMLRKGLSPDDARCALVFLIPYYMRGESGNVSLYARAKDYHAYCDALFPRVESALKNEFGGTFVGFADKSPIEETQAALRAGLAVRGDSYVIINEKYGSYVFIGEIITNNTAEKMGLDGSPKPVRECMHCGACRRDCPMKNGRGCLSAVTQKKGELSDDEKAYIREYGYVWGCDICQNACPLNKNAAQTPIEFFRADRIPTLSRVILDKMSDDEFAARAFSWRGRATVERNIDIFGNN